MKVILETDREYFSVEDVEKLISVSGVYFIHFGVGTVYVRPGMDLSKITMFVGDGKATRILRTGATSTRRRSMKEEIFEVDREIIEDRDAEMAALIRNDADAGVKKYRIGQIHYFINHIEVTEDEFWQRFIYLKRV